ncbi:MAG: nitrate reductase molybdenum cofactor assembly chaperone [Actinobacteria bacterium]|jgi:nitrate reductase molybdenum cofactor assembly chaperone NarJ/NarW|uniref:Unannotated protein n=1 Tax=freshwater metagenome TaxID=449393 RepID=A0A6J6NNL5_9ZZZZ|nr:nitrate reductase molybdenum cofactor assembly chaperone [Actinomycetota bacterium]NBO07786.1 nitrate reductase molybdenum cofactor assembly chaperone [Actinomycetota bacterium]NBP91558.1 nitrate reductase molybdenum cofactor assembly chaperone [Actinomycetota bacterium]
MSKEKARAVCAFALIYPEEDFFAKAAAMQALINGTPEVLSVPLSAFFEEVNELSLYELQQHYVETFDMRRKCSLFLTSWTHGDTRNRGMALLYFKQLYQRCGLTLSDEELPDHLAVVLEFAALQDPVEGELLLAEHHAALTLILDALTKANSPYRHILECVTATLPIITAEIEERAKALALSGPPKEFVGLSGAVSIALEPFSSRNIFEGVAQ